MCCCLVPDMEVLAQALTGIKIHQEIIEVNLLKTETSGATRVSIASRKQAIDLDISAVPPSEAADNFLMHLRDSPARPDETARELIHQTIPKPASASAWIPGSNQL